MTSNAAEVTAAALLEVVCPQGFEPEVGDKQSGVQRVEESASSADCGQQQVGEDHGYDEY